MVGAAAEERLAGGLADGLIHLSVGVKEGDDVLADPEQALAERVSPRNRQP